MQNTASGGDNYFVVVMCGMHFQAVISKRSSHRSRRSYMCVLKRSDFFI